MFQVYYNRKTDSWRVIYEGKLTSPFFNSRGAASAYLSLLQKGTRKPEYERRQR